eukprot:351536-Chlamydomonas_euryale.AAC.3
MSRNIYYYLGTGKANEFYGSVHRGAPEASDTHPQRPPIYLLHTPKDARNASDAYMHLGDLEAS